MRDTKDEKKNEYFKIVGAGDIEVSKNAHAQCGDSIGFSVGVSWGRYGYSGGVLGRSEARRLAEHILSLVNECAETEAEERIRKDREFAALK